MIVATAGHVDHGKTSLIRALTGVDTDRLEEERRRGMSIDLGFAYAQLGGDSPVGFVDVPGHERFVRNMLAGVASIDFALLVVAADDGPMPQTLEHLAILELLGVCRGAVALTKVDRVSEARQAAARREIEAVLEGTRLRGSVILPVAPTTGEGVDALRQLLVQAERDTALRPVLGNFRLAVDRAFTLTGMGVVVTGAVFSGSARVGDTLVLSPAGVEVRVRGIRAHDREADVALAGQRCSLNLAGAELRRIEPGRGDWVVAAAAHAPTERIDVRLRVLASEAAALKDGAHVGFHAGADACGARVAILGERAIAPGHEAFAQLVLDRPVLAMCGDRFVLRDQAARRTLGGGVVADPFGATRGRARPARIAELEAMLADGVESALRRLLALSPGGVRLDRFEQACNLAPDEAARLRAAVGATAIADGAGLVGVEDARWEALQEALLADVAQHHVDHPDSLGPTEDQAGGGGNPHGKALCRAAIRTLLARGMLVREGLSVRLPDHRPVLSTGDAALLERITGLLAVAGLRPPIVGELARTLSMEIPDLIAFLRRVSALGHLVQVADNRYFLPATVMELAAIARDLAQESADGSFNAAGYRDRSGIGRNLTIEVLEFLDRIGVTRFARDRRRMAGSGAAA